MKKISRKEIQATVNQSLLNVVASLASTDPSKKTKKLINKVSKKFSGELKSELKKHFRKMSKVTKSGVNGQSEKKVLSA